MWVYYFVLLVVALFFFLKYKHSFWTRRGIAQVEPEFIFGNIKGAAQGQCSFSEIHSECYKKLKSQNVKHGGMYSFYAPAWVPIDLDLIKRMMTTDYDYFSSHGLFSHENDLLSDNMFNATGTKWRSLRSKLSPSFSSGKLKNLFAMLYQLGDRFEKKIEDYSNKGQTLEMKELALCFGTDVVATCLFGLESDCINYPESDFRTISELMSEPRPIKFMIENTVNWSILGKLGYRIWSKQITNFFTKLVPEAMAFRKKNNLLRNDILGLLMQVKDNNQLTEKEIIANIVSIYLGGYETTSTTIAFLVYELSKNQEIQDKLRKEITNLSKLNPDGEFTYEDLVHMKYADMCIYETLRKYPPVPEVPRAPVKDYKIPGTNQVIPKGVLITTPVMSVHYDPEYYPNPEEFNPENFSPESKASRHEFSFLAFGGGPKICIGKRFAIMELKVCIIKLLKNHRFTVNPKTPDKFTFKINTPTLTAIEDILLDVAPVYN